MAQMFGDADEEKATQSPETTFIAADEFLSIFCGLFDATSVAVTLATRAKHPPAGIVLDSLHVSAQTPGAAAASARLYALCRRTPALHPLISAQENALVDAIVVGAFVVNVAAAAAAEYRTKTTQQRGPKNETDRV